MVKRIITNQTTQEGKWNLFIDLIVMESEDALSKIQKVAKLCFIYDAEVLNGGHLQYFNNQGTSQTCECICALIEIGAKEQAKILTMAMETLEEKGIANINSLEDYVAEAHKNKFGQQDHAYYICNPEVSSLLESFISKHEAEFFEVQK